MLRVTDELKDVPLRDAHVLDDLPRRVGDVLDSAVHQLRGKVCNERLETDVRAAAAQQVEKMVTQRFIIHRVAPFHRFG